MLCTENIKIESRDYEYLKLDMYGAPLVMLKGKTGYVMCGYLNIDAAEKLKDTAVRVTGVKDLESILKAKVASLTTGAKSLGIKEGDIVSDIIYKL